MVQKIRRLYNYYREYVRVDLILYAVLIAMIIIYSFLRLINAIELLSKSF